MTAVPRDLDAYLTAQRRAHPARAVRLPAHSERERALGARRRHARAPPSGSRDSLRAAGLAATVHETPGHPVVLGEWRGAPAGAPTVLVYGHYDVQPAEPLELWTSPPFEPTVRDGRIYARGSVDDKGQLFLHVKALEAHLAVRGTLPVNVIVLAEGEEEVGSENLAPFIEAHASGCACDARGDLRLGDVRARAAEHSLVAARARVLPDRRAGPGAATCTPAATAARW